MRELNQKKKRTLITFISLVLSSVLLLFPLFEFAHYIEEKGSVEEREQAERMVDVEKIIPDQAKREEIADGTKTETYHEKEASGVEEADKRQDSSNVADNRTGTLQEDHPVSQETTKVEGDVMEKAEEEPFATILGSETLEQSVENEPKSTVETIREIPAHAHSWIFDSYYQEPDCSNGGLQNEICAVCGETQTTPGVPTGKHDFSVEITGDCCSKEVVACNVCHLREVRETDPTNHIDVEDGFCYGCGQKVGAIIGREDYEAITP